MAVRYPIFWASHLETLWGGIGDSLFGMRVYPVTQLRPGNELDLVGQAF